MRGHLLAEHDLESIQHARLSVFNYLNQSMLYAF